MDKIQKAALAKAYRTALRQASIPMDQKEMDYFTALGLGRWWGGFCDYWQWDNAAINKLTEAQAKKHLARINSFKKRRA